jgi:hypothetical protein
LESSRHRAFTLLEATVALGILATALVLVAQIGLWSLRERARSAVRLEALEWAANVLESARACPWEELTSAWGAAQHLPEPLAKRLDDAKVSVRVEPEVSQPLVKRVTVQVHAPSEQRLEEPLVQLVGFFSARSTTIAGGKP